MHNRTTLHYSTQPNATQYNITQHNTTQHNTTHNTTLTQHRLPFQLNGERIIKLPGGPKLCGPYAVLSQHRGALLGDVLVAAMPMKNALCLVLQDSIIHSKHTLPHSPPPQQMAFIHPTKNHKKLALEGHLSSITCVIATQSFLISGGKDSLAFVWEIEKTVKGKKVTLLYSTRNNIWYLSIF